MPPLGVVGLQLQAGEYSDASGAFLLFLTNFVSIILSAILVFLLTGYADLKRLGANRDTVGAALRTVVFAALLILVPLVFTSIAVGVASLRAHRQMHRVWTLTLGFFVFSMAAAIVLGMGAANLFEPGKGLELAVNCFAYALSFICGPCLRDILHPGLDGAF